MKRIIQNLVFGFIIVLLTALSAYWTISMCWNMPPLEFTNLELMARIHRLFGWGWSVPAHEISYVMMSPRWLVLLSVWPVIVVFSRYSLSDFPVYQRIMSGLVRLFLLILIVFCLCDIERIEETDRVSEVILVDESDSMTQAMRRAAEEEVTRALANRDETVDLQVVAFSESPRSIDLSAIAEDGRFLQSGSDESASFSESLKVTDIASAIRYSYAMFPEGAERRILLLSDGNETQGDALSEAARARAQGVRIDVRRLKQVEASKEVLILGDEIADRNQLRVSQPFDIVLEIESTHATRAKVFYFVNGELDTKQTREVELDVGTNFVTFRGESDAAGEMLLRFEIGDLRDGEDRFKENNVFVDKLQILGKPKILYVEENSSSAQYLQRALQGYSGEGGQGFEVEFRTATGLPTTLKDLTKYAAVILGDVPRATQTGRTNVTSANMEILRDYVRRYGGGFIAVGGENAFGLGGYSNTIIENILPIEFKSVQTKNSASSAIALVIDKSGSMELNRNLEIAKEAAKASVGALQAQDRVVVIGFDDAPYVVVPATRAVNRYSINEKIGKMRPAGGTNIRDALELTYLELSMISAKTKHVILLTDGRSPYSGIDALVREMARARITVSTIALANADTTLLSRIANLGKGRAYVARDASSVPRLFVEETTRVTSKPIVEEPFVPHVARQHEMVKGVKLATLLGYVSTKAKSGSQTILTAPGGAPILSQWQYGNGKTTAFTSDAKNRWASQWIRDSKSFAQFWAQVVRSTMKQDEHQQFEMRVVRENERVRVMVDGISDSDVFLNGLSIVAEIEDPAGEKFELKLPQTAPGFYENTFSLHRFGTYFAHAALVDSGETIGYAQETFSFPYAQEYVHTASNEGLLEAIARTAGGCVDCAYDEMFKPEREGLREYTPIWPNYLWFAFALFGLDVVLRRIRFGASRLRKSA